MLQLWGDMICISGLAVKGIESIIYLLLLLLLSLIINEIYE
jgi:hypothetical protein